MRNFILVFFFLIQAHATTYYVSPSGNDSSSGSLSSPWQTISKAANTLVAGDTVSIRGGTYYEQITPKNSGSADAYITYTAYAGEEVTVDGSNGFSYAWNGLFNLSNRNYIEISGLRLFNSPGFGIFMDNSSNIRILKNHTSNTFYSGVYAGSSNYITVNGNEIEGANRGIGQESISMAGTQNFVVSNNRLHGGHTEGIDAKGGASNGKIFGNIVYDMARVGIYVDAWDTVNSNIDIYNNTVSNSQSADSGASQDGIRVGGERGGTAKNIKIYNNVVYNIVWTGIILSNWFESGYSEPKFDTISIFNNTIYNTGTRSGGGIQVQGSQYTGITLSNNIISKAKSFNIDAPSTIITNNLFDGGGTAGSNAIVGDPLFVNPGSDFHLQAGSPAINAGTSLGAPIIDFDYNARPQGGQFDIGAFEYVSVVSTTPDPTPAPTPAPSPTPAPAPAPAPALDKTVPQTAITFPAAGATYPTRSNVMIQATASDNVKVKVVKFYVNGRLKCSAYAAPYTCNWRVPRYQGTTFNLQTKAYDTSRNIGVSSTITIYAK